MAFIVGCGGSSSPKTSTYPDPPPTATAPIAAEVTPVAEAPAVPEPAAPATIRAEADLMSMDGVSKLGTVTFEQLGGSVSVIGHFSGLSPGQHGFYVHQVGDCGGKRAANAGLHFNPNKVKHGPIGATLRHLGDFGNLTVDKDGVATFGMTTDSVTVTPGPDSIVGRALIVHARKDDGKTQPSGSGGPAVACGVINGPGQVSTAMVSEARMLWQWTTGR